MHRTEQNRTSDSELLYRSFYDTSSEYTYLLPKYSNSSIGYIFWSFETKRSALEAREIYLKTSLVSTSLNLAYYTKSPFRFPCLRYSALAMRIPFWNALRAALPRSVSPLLNVGGFIPSPTTPSVLESLHYYSKIKPIQE